MPLPKTDERVLIVAPVGSDAAAMAALFIAQGLEVKICASLADCCECVPQGAGALLLTEEALAAAQAPELLETLNTQPTWSELPLIVLTSGGESRLLKLLDLASSAVSSVTLLERPMSSATLLRTMQVALRSRHRQYQVRDLLEEQQRKRGELEEAKARAEKELAERGLAEEALGKWAHEPLLNQKRSAGLRYGSAVAAAVIAIAIRLLLDPVLGEQATKATLYGAIALVVWYGGFGPAVFVTLAGYLAVNWLFISPRHALGFSADNIIGFALYLTSASLIIAFGLILRRKQTHAQASARVAVERQRQVEHEIEERERAEAALREANALLDSRAQELEKLVEKRTADLRQTNEALLRGLVRQDELTANLRDTVQQLETFSYSIVHDMRAPLRSMRSFAGFLEHDHGDKLDEQGRDYLQRIIGSATRMDALITDVLTYSRIAAGETTLTRVNLDELVTEIVEQYPQFQEKAEAIHIEHPLPSVRGNAALLTQIISNLLGNALKFVPPGRAPRVTVRAENGDSTVRLWVEDNGIGIPREQGEKIFGLFQRLHPIDQYSGTGVGLAIVKRAAERMGGKVGFESEVGVGSRFWIELLQAG